MVRAYSDGRFDVLNVRLFDENLFGPLAKCLHLTLLDVLALFELFDPLVKIVLASLLRHSLIIFLIFYYNFFNEVLSLQNKFTERGFGVLGFWGFGC